MAGVQFLRTEYEQRASIILKAQEIRKGIAETGRLIQSINLELAGLGAVVATVDSLVEREALQSSVESLRQSVKSTLESLAQAI